MQNWLLMSLIAPFLWAVVSVIDTHFVHDVYEDEYDGTVVSGVFQSLPWLLIPFGIVQFTFPEIEVAGLAFLAGGMFICSFFCYFKALFVSNDGALMQILWSISVLVVPFFAWMFIGEVLQGIHYVGIAIAFAGICLFNFDGKIKQVGFSRILLPMAGAVVFLSLSMVLTKEVQQPGADFWSIFLVFSAGATIFSLVILAIGKKNPFKRAQRIATLSGKYFPIFAIAEGLSIVATITSQKAISLAPAVSFVAVIESLVPVFMMMISVVIVFAFRNTTRFDASPYRKLVSGVWIKVLALAFIAIGIYTVA